MPYISFQPVGATGPAGATGPVGATGPIGVTGPQGTVSLVEVRKEAMIIHFIFCGDKEV